MQKRLVALRISTVQRDALRKLARRQDRSISWLIRKSIDEFLKKTKK
jgi:predicted transcriptional regulator